MTVKNDLTNLFEYWRRRLLRISRKLLRRHMNIHTIIIGRVREQNQGACEFLNFQFFVFLDEERDELTREIRDPSVHFGEDGIVVSEKHTAYEPGMGYMNIPRSTRSESICETERVRKCEC